MEGTYISSLAFQDSSPSPPLLLSYPSSALYHPSRRVQSFSVSFLNWFIIPFQARGCISSAIHTSPVSAMKQLRTTREWTWLMCFLGRAPFSVTLRKWKFCSFAADCTDWWLRFQVFELFSVTRQPNELASFITHKLRTQISGGVSVIIFWSSLNECMNSVQCWGPCCIFTPD